MTKSLNIFLLLISLSLHGNSYSQADFDLYPFDTQEKEDLFYSLLNELRCPKCQSSNLAGSNSPISNDLKREVFKLVQSGKTAEEVKTYLVQRYGNFIIYNPPIEPQTYVLWFGPFLLFCIALSGVFLLRRNLSK